METDVVQDTKLWKKGGEEFFEFLQLQLWPSNFLKIFLKSGGGDVLIKS